MNHLTPYHNTAWLCEPARLHQLALRVAKFPTCFSAKDVAKLRRKRLEAARDVVGMSVLAGGPDDPAEKNLATGAGIRAVKGRVGVIAVHGPVDQRMSSALEKAEGTSLEEVGVALDYLIADPSIGAVVLHVDSPGGSSYGTEELADKIFAARDQKPVYAIANSLMASAAYWVGSAAGTVIATPGGDVGGVGVYALHVDETAALEQDGLKVTMVQAGKFKAELASWKELTDEAAAYLQDQVNATYDKFVNAVKRNRGTSLEDVRKNYGQGRVLNADQALAAGMVDRVMSFEELMRKLTGAGAASQGRAASAETLRLKLAHQRRKEMV
jgi:signal peptide peptidase SppA